MTERQKNIQITVRYLKGSNAFFLTVAIKVIITTKYEALNQTHLPLNKFHLHCITKNAT